MIFRNYDKTIKILVALSKDLHCLLCGNLSLNFNFKSSLAEHYRTYHKKRTVDFFLNDVATKTPEELEEMLN